MSKTGLLKVILKVPVDTSDKLIAEETHNGL